MEIRLKDPLDVDDGGCGHKRIFCRDISRNDIVNKRRRCRHGDLNVVLSLNQLLSRAKTFFIVDFFFIVGLKCTKKNP